jgi:hypothetical protein
MLYKYFSEFSYIQLLKEYIERPPDGVKRDQMLVKKVVDKLNSREWKYILDSRTVLERIFVSFSELVENKNPLPPIYTKEEVEAWIDKYKREYKLDEHFKHYARL